MALTAEQRRGAAPANVRTFVAAWAEHGVALPADVQGALDRYDHVEGLKPPAADLSHQVVLAAYLEPRATQASVVKVATHQAARSLLDTGWTAARAVAALRVLDALERAVPVFIEGVRAEADRLMATITQAAQAPTTDVAALVRTGQREAAEVVAAAPVAIGDLAALRGIRDRMLVGFDWAGLETYDDWRTVPTSPPPGLAPGPVDYARHHYAAGARLWWPTLEQARAKAAQITREEKAKRDAERAEAVSTGAAWY